MRALRFGKRKSAYLLRTRALWLCSIAGVFAIAMAARPGLQQSFAQSQSSPAEASSSPASSAQAPAPEQQAKQEIKLDATAGQKHQIAEDCANLLKLANSLKAEVDKTTKDELSVTVVRQAGEIEQLAHKMRTQ
jgi:hypothetical protein